MSASPRRAERGTDTEHPPRYGTDVSEGSMRRTPSGRHSSALPSSSVAGPRPRHHRRRPRHGRRDDGQGHLRLDHAWTKDLDSTFEWVQASSAEVVQDPTAPPSGVRDCAPRDPAGNLARIEELRND